MSHKEMLVLVDEQDQTIGVEEKQLTHEKGLLHRAFSVFIFYEGGVEPELLLQQRQQDKYHCAGLWTNTCCSHPRPIEDIVAAGERRLFEEMGLRIPLTRVGGFHYTAKLDNGLTENEMDHVLIGFTKEKAVNFNRSEVQAIAWMPISELLQDMTQHPAQYTPWFMPALEIALTHQQSD